MDDATLIRYLKEIGRGRKAAGDLPRADAQALFAAMLAGRVPDLQLGGVLIALRVKGESLEELAGFAAACEASYKHIPPFVHSLSKDSPFALSAAEAARLEACPEPVEGGKPPAVPIVIPAYNGARQLPNLVPLLALMLARAGIPVLVHGVMTDAGRITTREVFAEMGIAPAGSTDEAREQLAARRLSFLPIDALAPQIAGLLALRRRLGVRNSAHTLAKMLQPFAGPAVRIVAVTHPDYLVRMREFFTRHDTGALLLRGVEGEAVAHPRREPVMEWAHGGAVVTWAADVHPSTGSGRTEPELPQKDAGVTARWIESVLAGKAPVPAPIQHQVECCMRAIRTL